MLTPFPDIMIDAAFFDRFHAYIPGWEIPKMRPEYFTNEYGLIVDYFAELTNFTSSRCLLGPEFRGEMNEEFSRVYHDMEGGILPIALPQEQVDVLMKEAEKGANARIEIDLEAQTVSTSEGVVFSFEVDAFQKHCLLEGLDRISLTLRHEAEISAYERARGGASL